MICGETAETLRKICEQRDRHNAGEIPGRSVAHGVIKGFLDTSLLMTAFHVEHPHHQPSFDLFVRCKKADACCAMHSLAEGYATLTSMPAPRRASGDQALFLSVTSASRCRSWPSMSRNSLKMLATTAATGLLGGAMYDAIIGHCALKADAKTNYTDFVRLPQPIAARVKRPDEAD